MSRTEKTQPFRVKLWDGTLARVARHDHRDGPCDLPSTMADDLFREPDLQLVADLRACRRCYWDLRWTGTFVCCCGMCRQQVEHRRAAKGARRRSRMELRDAVKRSRPHALDLAEFLGR